MPFFTFFAPIFFKIEDYFLADFLFFFIINKKKTQIMISLIIGPMFSGKTTELLRRLQRAIIAGKKAILLRPKIDTRETITHDELKKLDNIPYLFLQDLVDFNPDDYDYIGIDEGQFFNNLAHFANLWANSGKHIVVAGLDATSELSMFEEILQLIPFSEEVIKLNAVCTRCGSDNGAFTKFIGSQKKDKVLVGGKGVYEARCRKCWGLD
jgi:thymidine kinase